MSKRVTLVKDGRKQVVSDPSTVTTLRTQGWKVEKPKQERSAPAAKPEGDKK